jgi:hypothetical protein
MKTKISIILASLALAPVAQAATLVYSGVMVSTDGAATSTAAASTKTYTLDLQQNGGLQTQGAAGDIIGAQVTYANASVSTISFTDGSISTFTMTVASYTALSAAKATNTITVSTNTGLNAKNSTISINVSSNTAVASGGLIGSTLTIALYNNINATYTIVGGTDYSVGASSNATASAIALAMNIKIPDIFAYVNPVGGSTITIVTRSSGTVDNTYTLATSTPAALDIAGVAESANQAIAFSGGLDNASFTFYNGVSSLTYVNGLTWNSDPVYSSNTAVAVMNVANSANYGVTAATTASTVVTLTANSSGTYANSFLLSSSTGALTIGSNAFTGGKNSGVFCINGVCLTANVDYTVQTSSNITASNMAAAINANALLNTIVVASTAACPACGIVWTTASVVGVGYPVYSSTQSALTLSPFTSSSPVTGIANGTMYGGSISSYTINTPTITITGHGLTTTYAVWLSTSNNVTIAPLAWGTTYYAIVIDANNFKLATSLANANAGTFITFTSSRTSQTADRFTLNTTGLSGTPVFQLQASNDGVNFIGVTSGENGATIGVVTFATPYTAGSTTWALGYFPWRYLRLLYSGPTWGGTNFSFYVNQKTSSSAR